MASDDAELAFEWPADTEAVRVDVHVTIGAGAFPPNIQGNAIRVVASTGEPTFPDHEDRAEAFSPGPGTRNLIDMLNPCGDEPCTRTFPVHITGGTPGPALLDGDAFLSVNDRSLLAQRNPEAPELTLDFEWVGAVDAPEPSERR